MSAGRRLPMLIGLGRAARSLPLALLLWGAQLPIAAAVVLPFRYVLATGIGDRPAPELLARPSSAFLSDLARNVDGLFDVLGPLVSTAVLLALLANALLAGGALETLLASDARPLGHRFGRGAGRFAGRMLRVGAAAGCGALLVGVLAGMPFFVAAGKLFSDGREIGGTWMGVTGAGLGLLLALAVLLALDLARVRIVRDDRRDTLRALAGGLATVLRHPLRVLGAWGGIAIVGALLLAVYLLVAGAVPTGSLGAVLLLTLVQQIVMIVRAGLRVALWGAEIEIAETIDRR